MVPARFVRNMTDRPHVLFLVLDSMRRDRVSAYGHDRETTPAFDAFAAENTVYENAFVPAPWTLPSHWSMFTGRFPSEHGVTNGFTDEGLHRPDGVETIAEGLADRGYRTAGFSNNPWVGSLSGLDRGFDRFVEWDLEVSAEDGVPVRSRDALYSRFHWALGRAASQPQALVKRRFFTSNLAERATRWISTAAASGSPTFTFVNLMEAHSPYYPPKWAFGRLGLEPPNPVESRLLNVRLLAYVLGKADLEPDRRDRVLEFYDASLRFQDAKLRRVLDALREHGIYDDTRIVVCSDHGKTLGEYDRDGVPPHYLRDINTRVPLAVKPAGGRADRVESPVSLTGLADLCRTGDLGAFVADDGVLVEDHVPHTARKSREVERWRVFAEGETKYVRGPIGQEYVLRGSGPDETAVEMDSVDPDTVDGFRRRLDRRIDRLDEADSRAVGAAGPVEGQVESQLEDLGYLG